MNYSRCHKSVRTTKRPSYCPRNNGPDNLDDDSNGLSDDRITFNITLSIFKVFDTEVLLSHPTFLTINYSDSFPLVYFLIDGLFYVDKESHDLKVLA